MVEGIPFLWLKGSLIIELKRTHHGLWVDPDDQSTWLYHQWLLGETFTLHPSHPSPLPILSPPTKAEKVAVLQGEIKMLEDLLQEEPEAKCIREGETSIDGRVSFFVGGV
jgi:hypothetical protein